MRYALCTNKVGGFLEKRTLLAIVLIFIIYWFSSQYLWKQTALVPSTQTGTETSSPSSQTTQPMPIVEPSVDNDYIELSSQTPQNDEIYLQNDKLIISLSNKGGVINQVTLTEFYIKDTDQMVSLVPENKSFLHTNLLNSSLSDINNIIFDVYQTANSVIFTATNPETSTFIKKTFTLYDDYNLDFIFECNGVSPLESYSISVDSGINQTEFNKPAIKERGEMFKVISDIDPKPQSISLNKLRKNDQKLSGRVHWAAVRSKYFVFSLIPETKINAQSIDARYDRLTENIGFSMQVIFDKTTNIYDTYSLYLGPVDYDRLKATKEGMEHITELGGWLRPISKLFMYYIRFLHKAVPNYGVVIILFALTLKIILTPLTNKSMNSGRKLQQIQPKMREIQAKYKNDIKTQQEELRKLYKEHDVSPLGGCLPLLLQMPIFFALYPVLRSSLEFRQASFVGWLSDLSTPDQYWILPIVMGIFMFIQQKMMQGMQDTSNMDEKQLAMMQTNRMMSFIMPPFMVFIFSGLPAGLVLYWTTFNVFSIIQQYYMQKKQTQRGTT